MKNYQNIKMGKKIKIPRVSHLEEKFAYQIKAVGIPTPIREFKFHPDRKWRFDFYWETGWAVEINGGGWQGGGHNRNPIKLWENYEKYNAAMEMGIRVLLYTGTQVDNGIAVQQVQRIFK